MKVETRISGLLKVTVDGPRGRRVFSGPNLVTNTGLNGACGIDSAELPGAIGSVMRLAVGTGTNAPQPSDTLLGEHQRASAVDSSTINASLTMRPGWSVQGLVERCTFAPDGVSRNYTEAGLFTTTNTTGSSARMAQRALFRDELGAPTVVTVAEDEYLTVEWTTYIWRDLSDRVFNIDVDGIPTTVTVRPVAMASTSPRSTVWGVSNILFGGSVWEGGVYPATFELVDATASAPSGGISPTGTRTFQDAGVGKRDLTFVIPPTQGNAEGGIGGVVFGRYTGSSTGTSPLWRSQIKFDPPIPKDVTKELTLVLTIEAVAGEPED